MQIKYYLYTALNCGILEGMVFLGGLVVTTVPQLGVLLGGACLIIMIFLYFAVGFCVLYTCFS